MSKLNDFLNSLTLQQALVWLNSDEKFLHVVDNYAIVVRTDGTVIEDRVYLIEQRLTEILRETNNV